MSDDADPIGEFFDDYERQVQALFDASAAAIKGRTASTESDPLPQRAQSMMNRAVVFVKPHAAKNEAVVALVRSMLGEHGIAVVSEGVITGPEMARRGVVDAHYSALHRWAVGATRAEIKEMPLTDAARAAFKDKFGVAFDEATVMTAQQAAETLGNVSGAALFAKWESSSARMKLAPGVYVAKFDEEGYYVLNGFYLVNREKFLSDDAAVAWFVVEWPEATLSWAAFRSDVVGPTDPTAAPRGSIRGAIFAGYAALGLESAPNVSDNGVHASAGPLEAFKERCTWQPDHKADESDPFFAAVAEQGGTAAVARLAQWVHNRVVCIDGKTAPAFDLLEDRQTSEVVAVIAAYKDPQPPRAEGAAMPASPAARKPSSVADSSPPFQRSGSSVGAGAVDVGAKKPSNLEALRAKAATGGEGGAASDADPALALMPTRAKRPNRWLQRTPTPPPPPPVEDTKDDETIYEDTEFRSNHQEDYDWKRINEIYPMEAADLLPDDLSFADAEQGLHPDAFFLSALSILCQVPDVIRNLFVSKTRKMSGKYAFQFYGMNSWQQVVVDDFVPVHQGQPVFCRSPTKRVWPLLLERAYAQMYKSYDNVNGGNLAEVLHDMTGKPVLNVVFEAKYNSAANENAHEPAFWINLGQKLASKSVLVSGGTNRDLKDDTGLQRGHAYGVLGVVSMVAENNDKLDNFLVKLVNPFRDKKMEYSGPMCNSDRRWTDELRRKAGYTGGDGSKSIFFMTVPTFLKSFVGLQVCRLEGYDTRLFFHDAWTKASSGGNPTFTSWRKNPTYVVMNRNAKPVNAIVLLKQPDQRSKMTADNPDQQYRYVQAGITIAQHATDTHPTQTMLLTGNTHKFIHRGIFFNQREVASSVTFPAETAVYLVPSTYQQGQLSDFELIVYCEDEKVSFRRLEVENLVREPLTTRLKVSETKKAKADLRLQLSSEVHILVRQESRQSVPVAAGGGVGGSKRDLKGASAAPSGAGAAAGDTIAQHYLAFTVLDSEMKKVGGLSAAMNYTELSHVFPELAPGTYTIQVTCVKGPGTLPITLSIWTEPDARAELINDDPVAGGAEAEDDAPPHRPLGRKTSDSGASASGGDTGSGSRRDSRTSQTSDDAAKSDGSAPAPAKSDATKAPPPPDAVKAPTKPAAKPGAKPSPNKPSAEPAPPKVAPAKAEAPKKTPAPPATKAPSKSEPKAPAPKAASAKKAPVKK